MSDLTNKTIWMAGAFNHKRQTVRQLSTSTRARWRGVLARAKAVLSDGDCLVLIIASAKPLTSTPSEHDLLNAQISSLVFRKQKQYDALPSMRTYLEDDAGMRFEVALDLVEIEKSIRGLRPRRDRERARAVGIPSPLACFLLRLTRRN